MTSYPGRWLTLFGLAAGFACTAVQAAPAPADPAVLAEEKAGCMRNLKAIYEAIQAYQLDHKDLPDWLSDLVPQYLADANVLVCPSCRRTGKTEAAPLSDPKLPSSYLFEFCPLPLGSAAPNAPNRTRREWKRLQMGLIGSSVPLVRCRQHNPALNVAFDGKIYESPSMWELAFTNRVPASALTAASLFANESHPARAPSAAPVLRFAPRETEARKELLDLTPFYNAMLTENWHGSRGAPGNDLASLPTGIQTLAGIEFDIRGVVQLKSKSASSTNYPQEIKGIPVHQKCHRLHFLHAAGFGSAADEGQRLGAYVVHFATNQMRLEVPIVYGRDLRNWHALENEPTAGPELTVAWTGENATSKKAGRKVRLFVSTWTNVVPDFEIESIDIISAMATPAPFLIAISAD